MNRRSLAINGGLAAALVAVLAVGLASIGSPSSASADAGSTTTVRTADLSATVSATGNVSSATDVAVNFQGTGGTVTAIYVTPGQKVLKGQRLAAVDDTAAQQSLASAQANLASAQAQYAITVEGQTSAEQASTNAQIAAQKTSVDNA
jgi:multidrug efflux pump subunit AcrA (membrane-fusion protein)